MRHSVLIDEQLLCTYIQPCSRRQEYAYSHAYAFLFMDDHSPALALLRRCLPGALVDLVDKRSIIGQAHTGQSAESRWQSLFAALEQNHSSAGLVWDERCRKELKDALIKELNQLDHKRQALRQHQSSRYAVDANDRIAQRQI